MISECPVCHNQDLEFKQGTAKTGRNIGKPYKAQFCKPCGKMYFDNPPKAPNGNFQPKMASNFQPTEMPISTLEKKVDKILAILKENFPPRIEEEYEKEETENPF